MVLEAGTKGLSTAGTLVTTMEEGRREGTYSCFFPHSTQTAQYNKCVVFRKVDWSSGKMMHLSDLGLQFEPCTPCFFQLFFLFLLHFALRVCGSLDLSNCKVLLTMRNSVNTVSMLNSKSECVGMSEIAGDRHVMTMDMGVAEVLREGLSRRRDRDCSCRPRSLAPDQSTVLLLTAAVPYLELLGQWILRHAKWK
jgi:hypothetical protein